MPVAPPLLAGAAMLKSPSMEIDVIQQDDRLTHLALKGRLDLAGVQEVETRFLALTVARRKPAVVDLSAVDFMVSFGVRMLLSCARAMRQNGVELVLLSPSPQVESTLSAVNLQPILFTTHDPAAARARLGVD